MRLIATIDEENYDRSWKTVERSSARGIILRDGKLALVRYGGGFYKFPGGGVEEGEAPKETMIREVREETGLCVVEGSVREFGEFREIRKSDRAEDEIYHSTTYYYLASVGDETVPVKYTDEEKAAGCELEWVELEKAYKTDLEASREQKYLIREATVMRMLIDEKNA